MENFIKTINKLRLNNKNGWYYFNEIVNGKDIKIKGYNTWLQILKIDDISFPTTMNNSVKDFKKELSTAYTYTCNK